MIPLVVSLATVIACSLSSGSTATASSPPIALKSKNTSMSKSGYSSGLLTSTLITALSSGYNLSAEILASISKSSSL